MPKISVRLFVVLLLAVVLLAACAPPEPEIVEVEVIKEIEIEVEVTRIVEVEVEVIITPESPVYFEETASIMMQLMADGNLRNFEGLVRYEAGFLLATDKYPSTILGFVPLPEIEE